MRLAIRIFFLMIFGIIMVSACQRTPIEPTIEDRDIVLVWNQSDSETKQEIEIALKWYLSMLGAQLTPLNWENGVIWKSEKHLILRPDELGFNVSAQAHFKQLQTAFENTEEFQENAAIDLGRFVANTLNNTQHYYKIVGMPENYDTFKAMQDLAEEQAAINPSSVSFGYRKILLPNVTSNSLGFIAEEYTENFTESATVPKEMEVLDVMDNGQLRFAIYEDGKLRAGANEVYSIGGKPTKCMWCHESSFLPNFSSSSDFDGYLSKSAFNDTISHFNEQLSALRSNFDPFLNYGNNKEHVEMELLYIRFFEPSAKRLANEWNMTENEMMERLSELETHQYSEFPELGDLYYRDEVEKYAPFKSLSVPKNMRETENNQPNFL